MIILLTTGPDDPEISGFDKIICWTGYSESDNLLSLSHFVENHREELRAQILAWLFSLSQSVVSGDRLETIFSTRSDDSDWWLSGLASKSPWDSAGLVTAVKLAALEKLLLQLQPSHIDIDIQDKEIGVTVRDLAEATGICSSLRHIQPDAYVRRNWKRRALQHPILLALRGVIGFGKFVKARWKLRDSRLSPSRDSQKELLICNYLTNFEVEKKNNMGRPLFQSGFWGDLPNLFADAGWRLNWIHIFMTNGPVESAMKASGFVNNLNEMSGEDETHRILESEISIRIIIDVLFRMIKIWTVLFRLRSMHWRFPVLGRHVNVERILRKDWYAGFLGSEFLVSLLRKRLFDQVLSKMSDQRLCIYLFENQAWEKGLVWAWRKNAHGTLVGVTHASTRFWDLRLHDDPVANARINEHNSHLPDLIAVNSPYTLEEFKTEGFAEDRLVPCEAVRYAWAEGEVQRKPDGNRLNRRRILLLTDSRKGKTDQMLALVRNLTPQTLKKFSWVLKFHPNYVLSSEELSFPAEFSIVDSDMRSALTRVDLVIASSDTSASLDASLVGIRVIILRDGQSLNFSPMLGSPMAQFVDNLSGLETALKEAQDRKVTSLGSYFFLERGFPRWRQFIARF